MTTRKDAEQDAQDNVHLPLVQGLSRFAALTLLAAACLEGAAAGMASTWTAHQDWQG